MRHGRLQAMADHLHSLISSLPPGDQAEVASFMAALPARMAYLADEFSDLLPDGLRFEWVSDA